MCGYTYTFKVCSMRLENLGEVNSSCKEKLGELEVCKSEIGRLADVVEKRFSQVWDIRVFFSGIYMYIICCRSRRRRRRSSN